LPETAEAAAVKVNVQFTAPLELRVGLLQEAVTPAGNPETTVAALPAALAATDTPLIGIALTSNVAVPRAGMVRADCES
jgi:hypothetical protein